ncbi:metallophosphoesterase family protein [Halobium palmae]|uniref:Metallophosphoesterase family protein n=1 Tax=Halobium palmae TaxID=1776492 RepID=A0ABD5RYP5_9EURY
MVRVGWLSDSHIDPNSDAGAGSGLTEDVAALFEEWGVEHLYFNGDAVFQAGAFASGGYEHSTPEYYDRFWELVDASGYGDRVTVTPGNHDVPLQYFVESDERARLQFERTYDRDGVTVLMVNTVGPGAVSGSQEAGYGWTNGYVPYRQLRWLEDELSKAGDDTKLVFFHHHAWLTPGDPLASAATDTQSIEQLYWVCRNYRAIHDRLSDHDKVVCPQAHTAQFVAEGSSRVDGVEYLYKKHYYNVRDGGLTTYAFIDATEDGCTVTTVDRNTGEQNVILDAAY